MIVGLFLRNYKVFNATNFIPISTNESFVAFFGMNGVGKSSIFQALDTFFNNAPWYIHKSLNRTTQKVSEKTYVMPLFLIKKELIACNVEYKSLLKKISDYVWTVQKITVCSKEFIAFRDELKCRYDQNDYYLLPIGKKCDSNENIPYFGMLLRDSDFLKIFDIQNINQSDVSFEEENIETDVEDEEVENKISACENKVSKYFAKRKDFLGIIKELYSYMYLPTEIDVEGFTQIQNNNMQQLIHRDIKQEIANVITAEKLNAINTSLSKYIEDVSVRLGTYTYQRYKGKKDQVEMTDLVNTIIRAYFNNRVLTKTIGNIPVGELSSGEKRKALLDVAVAFLEKKGIEKNVILAVDEPELSLHISNCFNQFEKLQHICSKNVSVYITTHWYGFLSCCTNGIANYVSEPINDGNNRSGKRVITSFNIQIYNQQLNSGKKNKRIPDDVFLKGKFDLIQSIVSSICIEHPYNYLLVEGSSDKTYFEAYLRKYYSKNKLRILPLGGRDFVIQITKLLSDTIKSEKISSKAKIIGIIDTDARFKITDEMKKMTPPVSLMRIRYSVKIDNIILEKSCDWDDNNPATAIEDVLDPDIFREIFDRILSENTEFAEKFPDIKNMKNLKANCSRSAYRFSEIEREQLKQFFDDENLKLVIGGKESKRKVKDTFAEEYVKEIKDENMNKIKLINDLKNEFNFEK